MIYSLKHTQNTTLKMKPSLREAVSDLMTTETEANTSLLINIHTLK